MAPAALTSSSSHPFRLTTTTPRSRTSKPEKRHFLVIHAAKQEAQGNPKPTRFSLRLGRNNGSSSQDAEPEDATKTTKTGFPFSLNFNGAVTPNGSAIPNPLAPVLFSAPRRKDPNTVFVSSAAGQSGARTALALLKSGFTVRAGVPDLGAAQDLARLVSAYRIITPEQSRRLNAVQSPPSAAPAAIAKAIGGATKVVVTIGPGEDGPDGEVTAEDALNVVKAAGLAGVQHVVVVYDSARSGLAGGDVSTGNVIDGFKYFFANLSGLFTKVQPLTAAEFLTKVVEETEVAYTLIKAPLADDYLLGGTRGELVVTAEGSGGGGSAPVPTESLKVTKSQIAALVADIFRNTAVTENKVVKVSASTSATSKSVEELFGPLPEDGRRQAYREALAKAQAEEQALIASQKAQKSSEAAKKLREDVVQKFSEQEVLAAKLAEEAQQKAAAAGASLEGLFNKAKGLGEEFSWEKLSAQLKVVATLEKEEEDEPKVQVATIRGQAKARTLAPRKAVVKQPPKPKEKPQPEEKEVRNIFGGLFKQEVIYMDD